MATQVFDRSPEEVAAVRRFIDQVLAAHPARDDARLLASELVTNAIRYGGDGKITVSAAMCHYWIQVAVIDDGIDGVPHSQAFDEDAEDGRGLLVVDRVASRWGFVREHQSTTVWFELPIASRVQIDE